MDAMQEAGAPRVLVTGANGFVGMHLRTALAVRGAVLLAPGEGGLPDLDIRDDAGFAALIREVRPAALVHLAAIAAPARAEDDPQEAWAVNFEATRRLGEAAMRVAPDMRFVFAGTSDAYGASFVDAGAPVDERTALAPTNVYAATKAAADIAIGQMSHRGLRAVRFRPFNHTGPGQSDAYVVPGFAAQIARIASGMAEPVVRVGNLEVERDFVDVRDVVEAYAQAALGDLAHRPGLVFNLASGRPVRLSNVLRALIELSGVQVRVEVDPDRLRPADVARTCGDASAARAALGWSPRIDFPTTLADVYDDWRGRVGRAG